MERYTTKQAASLLGITEEELRAALRVHRQELPSRDPQYPNLLLENLVTALRDLLARDGTPAIASLETDSAGATGEVSGQGATVFSVTSGKGGVGKTSLCVNLASEFASRGYRTIVVDCDLGLANAHILAGLKPGATLCDFLDGKASLADIVVDAPGGVKLISGGSGVKKMADLDGEGRQRILDAILELRPHCDLIMLDTGAGISRGVTDFVSISEHTLIVTTSNFAAIADAYGIIKTLVQDGHKNTMHLIINRVRSPEEAEQVYKKLQGCTDRFLSFELNWLGLLPEDNSVEGAVLKRAPFCEAFPASVATRYLKKLASALERYLPRVPAKVK